MLFWTFPLVFQAAGQTKEGDPDGHPQKQGGQRCADASQQRAAAAVQGQPCVCVIACCSVQQNADISKTRSAEDFFLIHTRDVQLAASVKKVSVQLSAPLPSMHCLAWGTELPVCPPWDLPVVLTHTPVCDTCCMPVILPVNDPVTHTQKKQLPCNALLLQYLDNRKVRVNRQTDLSPSTGVGAV